MASKVKKILRANQDRWFTKIQEIFKSSECAACGSQDNLRFYRHHEEILSLIRNKHPDAKIKALLKCDEIFCANCCNLSQWVQWWVHPED